MIDGARKLPTTHVSVRVPWHDGRWAGTVCANPRGNTSCLVLPRIADNRDDEFEGHVDVAGKPWDSEGGKLPPCADERGAFMSPFAYSKATHHPYSHLAKYAHFRPTNFTYPAYSAAAVPYGWMIKEVKDGSPPKAAEFNLPYAADLEPDLPFSTRWVQERRNQLLMLDTFFSAIEPEESLVFFYAKRTPLTEDSRRIIVGIGSVMRVGHHVEYSYDGAPPSTGIRSVLWERSLHHSIRSTGTDGFLLPYHGLLDLAGDDPSINPADYILHAPEEFWSAFSMGAEHVSHDQAVTVLISCARLLERLEGVVPGNLSVARQWVDSQLNRIWRLRGAFPGLGSALSALGLSHGTLVAYAVGERMRATNGSPVGDPWPVVDEVLRNPSLLPNDVAATVGKATAKLWEQLKPDRRALLKLIARFAISADQATRWFVPEERNRAAIEVSDQDILSNPYLLFEGDRGQLDPVYVRTVDRGLFPEDSIALALPVPEPSACSEPIDPRRGRAFCVSALDYAASVEGHTLLLQSWLVQRVRDMDVVPTCTIGADWVDTFEEHLGDRLAPIELEAAARGWQLHEYGATRKLIASQIERRLKGKRHGGDYEWRDLIDAHLPPFSQASDPEVEEAARQEKSQALEEMYRSRFSLLVGPAGTGKTSLLKALLSIPEVSSGKVLLLAPTGKARVQMQAHTESAEAFTLAQFLLQWERYDPTSMTYRVTESPERERGYRTVIIDECSMLTEDQLAAALDAIEPTKVERQILVGDPRQLPPIGAGRPFVDIERRIKEADGAPDSVRFHGLAELKVIRRQSDWAGERADASATTRDDIMLARWFGGESPDPGADEAWDRLATGSATGISAKSWKTDEDLQELLLAEVKTTTKEIANRIGVTEGSEEDLFEVSLGGQQYGSAVFFWPSKVAGGSQKPAGGAGERAEAWQILAPRRAGETGVEGLNRRLQRLFRDRARLWAVPQDKTKPWLRKTFKPLGHQSILYGDKVINVRNHLRKDVYPEIDRPYVANGEIGIVVGQYKGQNWKPKKLPWKAEVEFSSQLGLKYGYGEWDFGEEGDAPLELAYALTIHKAQGSEFGVTFVVLPNPCRPLTRELLYTALTRQKHRIVLLFQGDLRELISLSHVRHSETARRLTNLFTAPEPVEYDGGFLEKGLIHLTDKGDLVRSKSELIIANRLHAMGISYAYEQPLVAPDYSIRYPDFTIEDAETGANVYLEHLGMMSDPGYRRRWDDKLAWYRAQGVLPADEGEGENGILLATSEAREPEPPAISALNAKGGIDLTLMEQRLRALLGL